MKFFDRRFTEQVEDLAYAQIGIDAVDAEIKSMMKLRKQNLFE